MCKSSIFKIFIPCLYNFTQPKYRLDLDPVKIFRIRFRIRPKWSGSDRIRILNPVFMPSIVRYSGKIQIGRYLLYPVILSAFNTATILTLNQMAVTHPTRVCLMEPREEEFIKKITQPPFLSLKSAIEAEVRLLRESVWMGRKQCMYIPVWNIVYTTGTTFCPYRLAQQPHSASMADLRQGGGLRGLLLHSFSLMDPD